MTAKSIVPGYESRRLAALRRLNILDTQPEPFFDRIARMAAEIMGTPMGMVSFVDDTRRWVKASYGADIPDAPREIAFCSRAVAENDVIFIPDMTANPELCNHPMVATERGVRFYAGAPIRTADGFPIGSVCTIDKVAHGDPAERESVRRLVDLAALVSSHLEGRRTVLRINRDGADSAGQGQDGHDRSEIYRLFFKHVPMSIAMFDCELRYVAVSDRYRQEFLLEDEDLIGRHHYAVSPHITDERKKAYARCLAGEIQKSDSTLVTRRDGSELWLRWAMYPWHGIDGNVGGMVLFAESTTDEVVSRVKFEQQDSFLRVVLENVRDGVVACDAAGRVSYFNGQIRAWYGLDDVSQAGEDGPNPRDLYLADGQTPMPIEEMPLYQALHKDGVRNLEMVIAPGGGPRRTVLANSQAILDSDGNKSGAVASFNDVTERFEVEGQLRQAQKLDALGHLTGGVAHDFNNLLTVILGNLELVTEGDLHQDAREQLTAAMEAADRGAALTRQLLAISRNQLLQPKKLDIRQQVESTLVLVRRSLGANIEVSTRFDDDLWLTDLDAGLLESSLINLAINSRDAMPDGGQLIIEAANIHLDEYFTAQRSGLLPGDYVMLAVSDTGTGIEPDTLQRVLDPFFTTKDVGKGSGLGLSMVHGFAKQSGGHVNLYSEPGLGTTVKMYFPRSAEGDSTVDETTSPGVAMGNETVLLVDDDAGIRFLANHMLSRLGYTVLAAESGPEALQILDVNPQVSLLFTDLVMPGGLSAGQLAEAAVACRPDIRILFSSGYTREQVRRDESLPANVQFLAKPYRIKDLAIKVRAALDGPGYGRG